MRDQQILIFAQSSSEAVNLQLILNFIDQQSTLAKFSDLKSYTAESDALLCIIVSMKSYLTELEQTLSKIQSSMPNVPILLLKDTDTSAASEYMYDSVTLPFNQSKLLQIIERCRAMRSGASVLPENIAMREMAELIVGNSDIIANVRTLISQVAGSDVNVLVLGESGTGKEVVAKCLHMLSKRHRNPFIPVNCGAIPSELLESELFGHEKGSFTGAYSSRKGRFELAAGGTIFLDEIGDMPHAMQVKLLRIIQERVFERVGSNKSIHADVRIIAATHRHLESAIKLGEFREDLYYRLNVFPIEMPALRTRTEDLPLLIDSIIKRLGKQQQCSLRIRDDAMKILQHYNWPGNIRELGNLIERLMVLYPNGEVTRSDLPGKYREGREIKPVKTGEMESLESFASTVIEKNLDRGVNLKEHLMNTELAFIKQALEASNGVVARAAEHLNMRRTTLVEKMRKYGINREKEDMAV